MKGDQARRNAVADKLLGPSCAVCGSTRSLTVHRMDGVAHEAFSRMGIKRFEETLTTGDYIRLCYSCHKGVHWVMKFLGTTPALWTRLGRDPSYKRE